MLRSTPYLRIARAILRVTLTVTVLGAVATGVVAARGLGSSRAVAPPPGPSLADSRIQAMSAFDQVTASSLAQSAAASSGASAAATRAAQTAQAERQAVAQQAARSAERDPRSVARIMLADHAWGADQFGCLDALWSKESGWNLQARNASSGAYGIPQALPGAKMASAGGDWQTNPITQIRWGLQYIDQVYGSPCGAWAHSQAMNWY